MVSLIVAVYNVEKYLDKCLNSISKQTYSNLEVIIIDDGSTDESGAICDLYSKKDARFQTFHISNKGVAHARKFGFKKSTGQYISFIDGDDWIDKDYCSKLLSRITENKADIIVCDFWMGNRVANNWKDTIYVGRGHIFEAYLNGEIWNRMWNKMYKRAIVEQTKFPIGRDLVEDGYWMPQALARSNKLVRISDCLYFYRLRNDSLMRKEKSLKEISDGMINQLGRLSILLQNSDTIDQKLLCNEYQKQVFDIIQTGYNLDKYEVFNTIYELTVSYIDLLKNDDINFNNFLKRLVEIKASKNLYQCYLKMLIFDSSVSLFNRVKTCVNFMLRRAKHYRLK